MSQFDNQDWLEGSGTIIYDPRREGMKNNTQWWCVVDVDREITRYYRWWLRREKHIHLMQPSWDAHISIVRGEKPHHSVLSLWKKYHKKRVTFQYQHGDIQTSKDKDNPGLFYWIRVKCPIADQIRQELKMRSTWKFEHITIGRTYY